jgi:hypothetical protein
MAQQPGQFQEMEARDTSIVGPEATQEGGLNATIDNPNDGQVLDPYALGNLLSTILEDADRYRRKFMAEILRDYTQYNGQLDDQDKAEWQSRIHIPLAKQSVDVSTARVIDALFSNDDFFDIAPYVKMDDAKTDMAKKIIKWQFWKGNVREGMRTAIKHAFICGYGPLKVTFDQRAVNVVKDAGGGAYQESVELRKNIAVDPILPPDFWIDPTGRNRFVIQRVKRTISDLWGLSKTQADPTTGMPIPAVYDPVQVALVKPGQVDMEREVQTSLIRRDTPYLASDIAVDVYEYWGDIYDPKTGAVIYRNVVCTFVGKGRSVVIRMPQANPFRHGMAPYIVVSPGLSPGQIYGWGLLRSETLISDATDRIFNIIMDKTLLQVPTMVVYPNALKNPEEFLGDKPTWKPGKMFQGKDPERPPFAPVTGFEPVSSQDLELLDRLMNLYQMGTGVNEFATGTPQTNNRKTKEEVQARVQSTQQVFNDAAQHIEENALSPLVKMIYMLTVQFEDQYDDMNLVRMFGDNQAAIQVLMALKQMPPEARWQQMFLDAEFRVTGISNEISRQADIQNLTGFLQSISADPTFGALIDKVELMRRWVRAYKQPQELVLPMKDALLQAENMAMIGMVMQQFGMMPQGTNPNNANQQNAAGARKGQEQAAEQRPKAQEQQGAQEQ